MRTDVIAGLLLVGLGFAWFERRSSHWQIKAPKPQGLGPSLSGCAKPSFPPLRWRFIGLGLAGGAAGLGYGSVALSVSGFSVVLPGRGEWLGLVRAKLVAAR